MGSSAVTDTGEMDLRIGARIKALRSECGWSLEELGRRSGISRATLSRLENAEVSATATVLGKLCSAFGMTLSRLIYLVEDDFPPLIRRSTQQVWDDPEKAFRRRSVSPPARALAGEALECEIGPATHIAYERSPRPGLEHHLMLLEGALQLTVDGESHALEAGDCLRYKLSGASSFETPARCGARYVLFMV